MTNDPGKGRLPSEVALFSFASLLASELRFKFDRPSWPILTFGTSGQFHTTASDHTLFGSMLGRKDCETRDESPSSHARIPACRYGRRVDRMLEWRDVAGVHEPLLQAGHAHGSEPPGISATLASAASGAGKQVSTVGSTAKPSSLEQDQQCGRRYLQGARKAKRNKSPQPTRSAYPANRENDRSRGLRSQRPAMGIDRRLRQGDGELHQGLGKRSQQRPCLDQHCQAAFPPRKPQAGG